MKSSVSGKLQQQQKLLQQLSSLGAAGTFQFNTGQINPSMTWSL
jgi:hypothetical protein